MGAAGPLQYRAPSRVYATALTGGVKPTLNVDPYDTPQRLDDDLGQSHRPKATRLDRPDPALQARSRGPGRARQGVDARRNHSRDDDAVFILAAMWDLAEDSHSTVLKASTMPVS